MNNPILRKNETLPHEDTSRALIAKAELDKRNLKFWNLDERSRIKRKLKEEDTKSDDTYRYIDKPAPLL